jgi:dGTPase
MVKVQGISHCKEWQDLIDFEVMPMYYCFNWSRPGIEGGLRISYATLGAFMKYPKESFTKETHE